LKAGELLDAYLAAWINGDGRSLPRIFHQDAIYSIKPFDPPLVSLPEIEAYWERVVGRQSDHSVRWMKPHYPGPESTTVSCEISIQFTDPRGRLGLFGAIYFELRSGKALELRQYYRANRIRPDV
jgi:hypothetical protein